MSAQTDSNIVEGPRKRRPPPQFAEAGDPPAARKKARPAMASAKTVATKGITEPPCPHIQPTPTNRGLEATEDSSESSDARSRSSTPNKSDDDDVPKEEEDLTELSMFCVPLFVSC